MQHFKFDYDYDYARQSLMTIINANSEHKLVYHSKVTDFKHALICVDGRRMHVIPTAIKVDNGYRCVLTEETLNIARALQTFAYGWRVLF